MKTPTMFELLQGRHLVFSVPSATKGKLETGWPQHGFPWLNATSSILAPSWLPSPSPPLPSLPPPLNFVLVPTESGDWLPVAMTTAIKGASHVTLS